MGRKPEDTKLDQLLAMFAAGFVIACLSWLIAPLGWPFDLVRHFTGHLALAGLFLGGLTWIRGGVRIAAGLGAAAAALAAAFLAAPFAPVTPHFDRPAVTVAVFNARYDRSALERFAAWAEAKDVDMLMLAEAHGAEVEALEALYAHWPHSLNSQSDVALPWRIYTTRIAVFSRAPLSAGVTPPYPTAGRYDRPRLYMVAQSPIGPVHVSALHPFPPILPGAIAIQRGLFDEVAERAPADGRFLVLGDLNSTVWSPVFDRLPGRRAGDPRFLTTFPAITPVGGIAIDHVLVGDALAVTHYEVGPDLGSDHRPVLARLSAVADDP
ncbi:MAG: endonuclease/exonuclease/phosphatase family protein [Oceanicaulis sp.]